jgi:hypothetical protein
MSLLRTRLIATQIVQRLPQFHRTITTTPVLRVSGYGKNPSVGQQQKAVESDIPGGEVPEYSGPSIKEKKTGRAEKVDQQRGSQIKSNRDAEFADNLYEKPQSLSKDGSDWDGKIHQMGTARSLQDAEHDTTGKPKKKATKLSGGAGKSDLGQSKRTITSSRPTYLDWDRSDEGLKEDLKDDARRIKDKAANKLEKAKLAAEDVGVDLKESAQELWTKAKKAGRHAKESIQETASEAMKPMYTESGEQQFKEDLYPVSDSEGARKGVKLPMSSPDSAAQASGDVLGEDVDALRKSFFDGPQDLPQGPGKRAVNEKGEPMETGTRGS